MIPRTARAASRILGNAPVAVRNGALLRAAALLRAHREEILTANAKDRAEACDLSPALLARLALDAAKVEDLARGLEAVADYTGSAPRPFLHRDLP